MSEAKKSGLSKPALAAIIGALALTVGIILYNSGVFSATNASSGTGASGMKQPSAANQENTSGRGSLRSTGDMNSPQSLSGKPLNGPQIVADGKVVDPAGQGIPDVRVQCTNCQTAAAMVLTDQEGNFKLPYRFDQNGDMQKMVIVVSKGKQSTKHFIAVSNAQRLKLELK